MIRTDYTFIEVQSNTSRNANMNAIVEHLLGHFAGVSFAEISARINAEAAAMNKAELYAACLATGVLRPAKADSRVKLIASMIRLVSERKASAERCAAGFIRS
jgi:hypothetical protein